MTRNVISQAELHIRSGRHQAAMDVLGNAARANDPEALAYLATMCLSGDIVKRDLTLSRDLYRRAAEAGNASAAAAYRAFVANGTGGEADWASAIRLLEEAAPNDENARQEVELISQMRLHDDGSPAASFAVEQLSASPAVTLVRSLFSEAECDFLVHAAMPAFQPSVVVDPTTGEQRPNPVRTSDATGFPLVAERPAIHALCRRLAAASGTDVGQGEPLQILRYRPGQEYRPHFDAIDGADNQRILTFLVYLNDDYEGGETKFLTGGLRVKGRKGDGLLFRNADNAGNSDPHSQHAGLPVTAGEKLLASRWIRERPLTY